MPITIESVAASLRTTKVRIGQAEHTMKLIDGFTMDRLVALFPVPAPPKVRVGTNPDGTPVFHPDEHDQNYLIQRGRANASLYAAITGLALDITGPDGKVFDPLSAERDAQGGAKAAQAYADHISKGMPKYLISDIVQKHRLASQGQATDDEAAVGKSSSSTSPESPEPDRP